MSQEIEAKFLALLEKQEDDRREEKIQEAQARLDEEKAKTADRLGDEKAKSARFNRIAGLVVTLVAGGGSYGGLHLSDSSDEATDKIKAKVAGRLVVLEQARLDAQGDITALQDENQELRDKLIKLDTTVRERHRMSDGAIEFEAHRRRPIRAKRKLDVEQYRVDLFGD